MNREKKTWRDLEYGPSGKDIDLGTLSLCGYRPPEACEVHVSALAKDWRESVNHHSSFLPPCQDQVSAPRFCMGDVLVYQHSF